ncbi:hypothetical protein C4568_05065 [Candidatus Parcubacteria bacterium]|nr:MAG: hypothetical protein C4568_05065 [Candidatus Parcubacteria bacterium]
MQAPLVDFLQALAYIAATSSGVPFFNHRLDEEGDHALECHNLKAQAGDASLQTLFRGIVENQGADEACDYDFHNPAPFAKGAGCNCF